ncbi:MAG TPA: type II secretion system F family protein [Candidatus Methylacidiphilales bacterium]|jgi:tight adherence protein B|nr:type II secretion system F family protein [Candidatus Methylacidiphilales bacterium]
MPDPMFLLICGCFFGALLLIAWNYHQSTASPQMDLREKLKNLAKDPEAMAREIELGSERKSVFATIDFRGIFAKFTGQSYMDTLEKELTQCDIPLKPGEFLAMRCGGAVVGGILTLVLSHNPYLAAAVAGFIGLFLHIPLLKIKRAMRIDRFVTQLAEFLVLITNSLRSGQTFLQGVDIASKDSPNPIGMEFRLLLKETNLGVPVETAFSNMLLRVPSEDLKIVMSAFSIQRNVGGNLADIMDQVAAMIRQRITIQGQIKVLTTQGKLSGAIVGLLPFGLGTAIFLINPEYMSKLWTPRTEDGLQFTERYLGPLMLCLGIFMELLGCFVIYKICDIEV